jgi:excisionase family DNA binding protein
MALTNIFRYGINPPMNMLSVYTTTNERKSLNPKRTMKLLTTDETAARLGVTKRRVQAMIRAGRLPAEKMGRDWFVREQDLALVADRKPGRPPAAKPAKKSAKKGAK